MNKLFIIVLLLLMALVGCSGSQPALEVGQKIGAVRLTMLDGSYHILDEYRGKKVVLLFWATWCSRSATVMDKVIEEMPKYAGRGEVVFIAASVDEPHKFDEVRERIERRGLHGFLHAFSGNAGDDEAFLTLRGSTIPYIVVFGAQGEVIGVGKDEKVLAQAFGTAK